jgi:hypothetical protein
MAMEAEIPENVSMDSIDGSTAGSDAAVLTASITRDETQDHGHELFPTQLLFRSTDGTALRIEHRTTTISELRVGVSAACYSCSVVLDAVTSHCSGLISIESIVAVSVPSDNFPIEITHQPVSDAGKLRRARLELFFFFFFFFR